MDTTHFFEQANEMVDSLFSGGSRYQVEKIATVVVYAVISVASLAWAFSGEGASNDLGATFTAGRLSEIDDQNLHLINAGEAWTTVRVVLNKKYLWTAPSVDANSQVTLNPEDFTYYYHIPRPWGRQDWEKLAAETKLPARAPGTLAIKDVRIWAREGHSDIELGADGKPVSTEKAAAELERNQANQAAETP